MENAKCMALAGDKGGAINELRQFTQDPWQNTSVAPYAVMALATLAPRTEPAAAGGRRARRGPAEARAGPAEGPGAPRALALSSRAGVAGSRQIRRSPAGARLDQAARAEQADHGRGVLRSCQCRIAEGRKADRDGPAATREPGPQARADGAATNLLAQGNAAFNESAQKLETAGPSEFKGPLPATAMPASACTTRPPGRTAALADAEVAAARLKLQQDRQKALQAEADKKAPPGTKAAAGPAAGRAPQRVPVQPAEQKARAAYQKLIARLQRHAACRSMPGSSWPSCSPTATSTTRRSSC